MEFEFDEENGTLVDKLTGERCLIFPKARIEQIFQRLTDLFQSGAQVIITEAFKAAGKWYVNEVAKEKKTGEAEFLKSAVQRLMDAGLGRIEITEFDPATAEVKFRIWNNFFAEMHDENASYCSCVEAYVKGMYEQLMLKTPQTVETRCIAKGDPYCEWEIGSAKGET